MVLFFAIISVSVDAYFAGLAYNLHKKLTFSETLFAGMFTLLMCLIAGAFRALIEAVGNWINAVGGLLLIGIGIGYIKDYFAGNDSCGNKRTLTALGLSIGVDAAIACAAMTEINFIACSILLFMFHTFFIYLSTLTVKPLKVFRGLTVASGVFLIFLGINRLLI